MDARVEPLTHRETEDTTVISARADLARRRLRLTLFLLIMLLGLVLAISIFAMQRLYRSAEDRYVKQAIPLRTATRDLVLQLAYETSGVQAYLITSDRAALDPYFAGRNGSGNDLATIGRLARGRPELESRLRDMRREITSLNGYFARQIVFVADGLEGRQKARQDVLDGVHRFNRFRATAAAMQQSVDSFVARTRRAERRTFEATLAGVIGTGLLTLLIAFELLVRVPERFRTLYAAEESARERAELGANAARALEHIGDPVILVDEDGIVRVWNPAAEVVFGVREAGALGRPALELVPDLEALEAAASSAGSVVPIEIGGSEHWFAMVVTAFDDGRVIALRDVTQEHALEQTRMEFVATASHELRTPVSAVFGAARTLKEHGQALSPEQRRRLTQMIDDESERLVEITDQILATAELDQGRLTFTETECDIADICRGVVRSASNRHGGKWRFVFSAPTSLAPVVCDPTRLRQVVTNLVDNAVKYSPDGGVVDVRVNDLPEHVRIEVSDEGPGITLAEQERIFDKFYRLDPHMKSGVGGSGLGLYISRKIVEQAGGRISVHSEPGQGATFVVELPRSSP
jgi:two-component system phosphate regulon sensor histidine kinase PhoR